MTDRTQSFSGRTDNCPAIEALVEASSNREIARHLESCAHCRTELAMYRSFENDEPRPDEVASVAWIEGQLRRAMPSAPAVNSPWDRLRAWWHSALPNVRPAYAMAAASLVILVIAGISMRQGPEPVRPGGVVMRSSRLEALSPTGDLDRTPAEFRWEAAPGAATYHVELLLVDRSLIWSADSKLASIEIPAGLRGRLVPGRAFQWRVTARDSSGKSLGATDLQTFHILTTRP